MSELSARSDRSASRDESVELNQQSQQQQAATSPVSLPAVIEQSNGEVSSSSSPGHRYTAAQREVMLTAAERAKKRRDEEEAEFEAARERARKKAEALAAQCESKPKLLPTPKPDEKKQDEDTSTTSNKSFIESSDAAAINALSQQDKPWASPENESKPTSTDTTTPAGTVMTSTDNNQKPAQKEEESAVKASDSKEIKGKEHKRKDPATIPDSDSPAGNNDGEVSSSWAQIRSDKPHQLEDEKDNQRWEEYVKGIQNHKTAEAKTSSDSAAAGWNDYANRLQTSTEIRMNAAIDKYAADRNIDPALLDGMRPKDREPLRLQRPYRDNNMSGNAGGRRGYSNNNNGGNNNYSNRNGDRRQQNHRDDGRRDLAVNGKKLEQSISPVDQHQLSFESWPSLGGSQPTNNKAKQQQQQKTEQKVPLDDEENNLFKKKKKQSKVKNVDEKKASEEITLDHKDDEEKQEENGTIVTITATENMDEVSEKNDHQEKEKREGEQVTDKMDGSIVDLHEHDNHHPEEDVEESVPEMVEASESGSLVSHNITDTVPTPESELFVGRARTYSAVAVFDHWTRAERHDFLQKSKECIFPDAIERLAEMKPATLTFRTVSDDNQQVKKG
ncbi:hypothetical protein BDA99DRAFT_105211 [Phascolomyces articulosus]|uniref:Uncharacterized protein n=1 Tax=Phascolomyces articulosus TaxID=60185 RepID=A0AAD5KAP8_9FUNG|nr:hypothetical protein BDA99DRAFT_105211 [Phascolomyces articulosus]